MYTLFDDTAIMGGVCFRCTMRMLSQIYNEDKAVELYRFAMEIDKAQNVVDLNVGPADDNDDHIVPTFEESSFATAPAVNYMDGIGVVTESGN